MRIDLRHGRAERRYLLHPPASSPPDPLPLVVQLHGRGVDPVSFDRWTRFSSMADEAGFALALPSAIGGIWDDGRYPWIEQGPDDVGFLGAVIDDTCRRLPIDPRRVYVVGMSNGAAMAGRLACEIPDRLAAVAQVAGTAAASIAEGCRPDVPLPILVMHGTGDRFAPYEGGRARGFMARLILQRPAQPSIGVEAWARRWMAADGAGSEAETERIGPDVVLRRWRGSSPDSEVVVYRIQGGGHTWPGDPLWMPPIFGRTSRTLDATRIIWAFFARHAREP
jgi:polyhydroxybutyrate depolymerase